MSSYQIKKKNVQLQVQYVQQYWTPLLQHEIDILPLYQEIPHWQNYFIIPLSIRAICMAQLPSSAMYMRNLNLLDVNNSFASSEEEDEYEYGYEMNSGIECEGNGKGDCDEDRLYIRCTMNDRIQPLNTYISSLFTIDKKKHCIYDISIQLYRILLLMSSRGIFHVKLYECLSVSKIDYNLKISGCTQHSFAVNTESDKWIHAILPFDTSRAWLPIKLHILTFLSVASYLSVKDVKEIVENVWISCCNNRMVEMKCYNVQDKLRCVEWSVAAFANKSAETVKARVMKYAGRWNLYVGFYGVLQLIFKYGLYDSTEELRQLVQEVCAFYPVSA